jgi:hypothetical protein
VANQGLSSCEEWILELGAFREHVARRVWRHDIGEADPEVFHTATMIGQWVVSPTVMAAQLVGI